MYQLKGFVGIETLVSNVAGVIAPVGELSTNSMTFSKDVRSFTSNLNRLLTLFSFSSRSTDNGKIPEPAAITNMGLKIADWVFNRQMALNFEETKDQFILAFINEFLPTCDNLSCGEMITSIDGHHFPEWVTWKNRDFVVENNLNKLWFSNDSFAHQYDEYEIVIIPPIVNVDYFFQQPPNVITEINKRNFSETLEVVRIARNNLPETILAADTYDYVNPNNPADRKETNWTLLIYGPAGNDADIIASAIADYILAYSTHTLEEWKVIFPDIFKHTEFIVLPKWNNFAIPNMSLQTGIYSPVINFKTEMANAKAMLPNYAPAHIENHLNVMPNVYKSLSMLMIGNFENRDNLFEIKQIFPDIINVSTTSTDFNRMNVKTQGFLNLLSNMIPLAETMTRYTDIPVGMRRTVRNGIMYLSATYLKVQYLVAAKNNLM